MAPTAEMNDATARKRLLIARADTHRDVIELECRRIARRAEEAREFVRQGRWWLLGGSVVGGLLLAPRLRSLLGWLPEIPALLRAFRRRA